MECRRWEVRRPLADRLADDLLEPLDALLDDFGWLWLLFLLDELRLEPDRFDPPRFTLELCLPPPPPPLPRANA